jgi:serine/threonine-protein kinase
MKRVRGVTLEDIIEAYKKRPEAVQKRYSRQRMLRAFCSVCLAVDYAHQHGVLHRDLKPSNVMLGDFGEVYVLDWGLAKIVKASEVVQVEEAPPPVDVDVTAPGSLIGTLGYMAPEQIRCQPNALRPTSDVYALGAILFEVLALTELHPRTSNRGIITSTLGEVDARPSVRVPDQDIPPELDEICVKAVSTNPGKRYQNARELQQAVQRFLDGERDQQLRKSMAHDHAEAAARILAEAGDGESPTVDERRSAMREIGRALALDPSNEQAMETMVEMLTLPPSELPEEVRQQIQNQQDAQARWMGRIAGVAYFSFLLYLPLFLWAGVKNTAALGLFYLMAVFTGGLSIWTASRAKARERMVFVVMIISTVWMATAAMFFGPLVLMPAMVAVNTGAFALYLDGWPRALSVVFGCLAILVPVVLEWTSVMEASYLFTGQGMVVQPNAIGFDPHTTILILLVGGVATVLTSSFSIMGVRDALRKAQRTVFLQTWHIRQLLPSSARKSRSKS